MNGDGYSVSLDVLHSRCAEDYNPETDEFRMHSITLWGFD